mmetsp:Transcript_14601/g.41487  ORF Transcript_14601/g.41487 Transcript_14601/m.41487 type:complete len:260 (+) Transcript_14601:845-1624(+)
MWRGIPTLPQYEFLGRNPTLCAGGPGRTEASAQKILNLPEGGGAVVEAEEYTPAVRTGAGVCAPRARRRVRPVGSYSFLWAPPLRRISPRRARTQPRWAYSGAPPPPPRRPCRRVPRPQPARYSTRSSPHGVPPTRGVSWKPRHILRNSHSRTARPPPFSECRPSAGRPSERQMPVTQRGSYCQVQWPVLHSSERTPSGSKFDVFPPSGYLLCRSGACEYTPPGPGAFSGRPRAGAAERLAVWRGMSCTREFPPLQPGN